MLLKNTLTQEVAQVKSLHDEVAQVKKNHSGKKKFSGKRNSKLYQIDKLSTPDIHNRYLSKIIEVLMW
jgi:hypothetical protein